MAKLTKEEIIASLKEMTIVELNELVKAVEHEFGVTAAARLPVRKLPLLKKKPRLPKDRAKSPSSSRPSAKPKLPSLRPSKPSPVWVLWMPRNSLTAPLSPSKRRFHPSKPKNTRKLLSLPAPKSKSNSLIPCFAKSETCLRAGFYRI